MYQFNMSIDAEHAHWFFDAQKVLAANVKRAGGITAAKECAKRLNISVACENERKAAVTESVREFVTETLLTTAKTEYLTRALSLPLLSRESYKILLLTLVAFDRDCERELIEKPLKIADNLALDGFYNFRLSELKKRWNDIAELAVSNSVYLNDDETLNELLRFLMSAISPKIMRLDVIKGERQYNIRGRYKESGFEYSVISPEQLMAYLINIAPVELTLHGGAWDDKLYKRLVSVFDAKPPEEPRAE